MRETVPSVALVRTCPRDPRAEVERWGGMIGELSLARVPGAAAPGPESLAV
ncbi:MAG: hypothetical protein NVSMB65_20370 [Chloroflexota bacterium]